MGKLRNDQAGFSAFEMIVVLVVLALIAGAGYFAYKHHHKATTTSVNTTKATTDPYATWKTYSNSQLSFKYPNGWTANEGRGQYRVAEATSPAFKSSAMATAQNPGAPVTLSLQLSNDSSTIDCAGAPCQVAAVASLANSQLPGAVLAVVNQTSNNGTQFTEYVVASSGTKVGDTSVNAVKAGNSGVYVFGQPYYSPVGGGLTTAARVTNVTALQSDSHFKDLIRLINSTKFQ